LFGRFNKWFGGAALGASAEQSEAPGAAPTIDATTVVVELGEIDQTADDATDGQVKTG
jgi:hypothetical protein